MKRLLMAKHNYPGLYFQIVVFRWFKESKCNPVLQFIKNQEKLFFCSQIWKSKTARYGPFNFDRKSETDVKVSLEQVWHKSWKDYWWRNTSTVYYMSAMRARSQKTAQNTHQISQLLNQVGIFLIYYHRGAFNNYVDKKRGTVESPRRGSRDKGWIVGKMSIFVYLRGEGVKIG